MLKIIAVSTLPQLDTHMVERQTQDERFRFDQAKLKFSEDGTCGVYFWSHISDGGTLSEVVTKPLTSYGRAAIEVVAGHIYSKFFNTPNYRLLSSRTAPGFATAFADINDVVKNRHTDAAKRFDGNRINLSTFNSCIQADIKKGTLAVVVMDALDCISLGDASNQDLQTLLDSPDSMKDLGRLMAADFVTQNADRFGWLRWICRVVDPQFSPGNTNLGNIVYLSPSQSEGKAHLYAIDSAINDCADPPQATKRLGAFLHMLSGAPAETPLTSTEGSRLTQAIVGAMVKTNGSSEFAGTPEGMRFFSALTRKLATHIDSSLYTHFRAHPNVIANQILIEDLTLEGDALAQRISEIVAATADSIMFGEFLKDTTKTRGDEIGSLDTPANRALLKQGFMAGLQEFSSSITPTFVQEELLTVQLQLPGIDGADRVTDFITQILPIHLANIKGHLEK